MTPLLPPERRKVSAMIDPLAVLRKRVSPSGWSTPPTDDHKLLIWHGELCGVFFEIIDGKLDADVLLLQPTPSKRDRSIRTLVHLDDFMDGGPGPPQAIGIRRGAAVGPGGPSCDWEQDEATRRSVSRW